MGPDLPLWEGVARLLLVVLLAGAVGLERELRDQEAGLRTHMLVGLGSALFVIVGNFSWSELEFGNDVGVVLDPSRVVAYVITGIGFLGAGTIIKHGINIKGLTTAASLWVVAAVGVAVGAGDYGLGVVATAIVLLSLWPVRMLANALGLRASRGHRLELELEPQGSVAAVLARLEAQGAETMSAKLTEEDDVRRLELVMVQSDADLGRLLDAAASAPDVRSATIAP
ncbi:MAG TPA: MgtC/SapB family protein [Gaiella sp.]|nr:MgtC/SapB family protein [Gaiella sp.]